MLRAVTTLLSPSYESVAVKPTIAVSPGVADASRPEPEQQVGFASPVASRHLTPQQPVSMLP